MDRFRIIGAVLFAAAAAASSTFAQSAACSDSFAVAEVGEGKTWRLAAFDKSAFGAATVADGKLTLAGRGGDIYGTRNEFVAVYRSDIQGDFDVSVELVSQDSVHEWSQAGIVAATDLTNLAKGGYVAVDLSPGHGYTVFFDQKAPVGQLDGNSGVGKTAYPSWLRLAKKGMQYTAWYMNMEGAAWIPLPNPPQSLNTQANAQIGLFTVSHNAGETGKAVFDNFTCMHTATTHLSKGGSRFPQGFPSLLPSLSTDALGKVSRETAGIAIPVRIFER
ncbi:MAG: hypothetical protein ABIW76_20270 [Fibrobacteria bacterium]